jgi:hypothetical protein
MKYIFPLIGLVFASACGEIKMGKNGGLGELRQLQAIAIPMNDSLVFDSICAALTNKSGKLASSLPNALNFTVIEKDCDKKTVTSGTQQVRVESSSTDGYQFRRQDTNGLFLFPSVETQDRGIMKALCSGSATTLPVMKTANEAMWIRASGFSDNCPSASSEACIEVETGSREGTTESFRIHSREFIRFKILASAGDYGYFTFRKSFAENNCDRGKNTESTATLVR